MAPVQPAPATPNLSPPAAPKKFKPYWAEIQDWRRDPRYQRLAPPVQAPTRPPPVRATFRRDLLEDQSERQARASVSPAKGSTAPSSAREACSQEPTEARSASLIDDGPAPSAASTEPVNGPAARIQEGPAVGEVGERREQENLPVEIPEPSANSNRSLRTKFRNKPERKAPVMRSKPLARDTKQRRLPAKQLTMNTFGLRGTAVQGFDGPVEDQEMVGVQQTAAIAEHRVDEQMDDVQRTAAIALPQPAVEVRPLATTNNPRPVIQPPPREERPEPVPEPTGFFRLSKRDAVREIRQRLFAYTQMTPGELGRSDVHQCLVDAHTYYTTPGPDGNLPLDDSAPALAQIYCHEIESLVRQTLAAHQIAAPEKNTTLLLCLALKNGPHFDFSRGNDEIKRTTPLETAAALELATLLHWSAGALQYHLPEAKLVAANNKTTTTNNPSAEGTLSHLFSTTRTALQAPSSNLAELSSFATSRREIWRALAYEKIRRRGDGQFCEDLTALRLGIVAWTLASKSPRREFILQQQQHDHQQQQQQTQQQQHWIVGLRNCCKVIQDSVIDFGGRRV